MYKSTQHRLFTQKKQITTQILPFYNLSLQIIFKKITVMEIQSKALTNLFQLMNEIDQKVANKKTKAVLFVGLTRVGKSTSFNWVSRVPLKAVKEGKGRKICYETQKNENLLAEISAGFTSCTLVPNIVNYQDYHIIDTAGYEDKRNYIGTIGVAYALKAIFQVFEQVKFVIVMPETAIFSHQDDLFATFHNFLSMFNMAQITPHLKSQIFSSTSLLLTKCQRPGDIKQDVENCLDQLKDPSLDVPSKQLIAELLSHLLSSQKIVFFEMARLNQSPETPEVIEKLNQKPWSFLKVKQAKTNEQCPKSIIMLPFNSLYEKLQASQKELIKQNISKRINCYKQFCQILNEVIGTNIQIDQINHPTLNSQFFLDKISSWIVTHDYYKSEKHINGGQIQVYNSLPEKLNAFKLLLEIYTILMESTLPEFAQNESIPQQFMKNMANSRIRFIKLSKLLMKMYSNRSQVGMVILKLKYILLRGIRQFEMLYDISPYHVSDAAQKINDAIYQVFPISQESIQSNYIKSFKLEQTQTVPFDISDNAKNTIQEYFATKKDAIEFQEYIKQYRQRTKEPIPESYPLMKEVSLTLAKYSFQQQNYVSAKQFLLTSFDCQSSYERYLKKIHSETYPNTAQQPIPPQASAAFDSNMKKHYLSRVIILNALKKTLIKAKNYDLAIKIASINRDIISVCQIYDKILKGSLELSRRKQILKQYGQYCFNHARWRQSCMYLQQVFNLQNLSFEEKTSLNNLLVEYAQNEARSKQSYVNYLKSYSFIDVDNTQLQDLITRIKEATV